MKSLFVIFMSIFLFLLTFVADDSYAGSARSSDEQEPKQAVKTKIYQQGGYQVNQLVVPGFDDLPLDRKLYIYYLSKALEVGRDIVWKQYSVEGLAIRNLFEAMYKYADAYSAIHRVAMEQYMIRLYGMYSNYDVYANEKFIPEEPLDYQAFLAMAELAQELAKEDSETVDFVAEAKRLRKSIFVKGYKSHWNVQDVSGSLDLIADSNSNFYGPGVMQSDLEELSEEQKVHPLSYPVLNDKGEVELRIHRIGDGFSDELTWVDHYLAKAAEHANEQEKAIIAAKRRTLRTGDPMDMRTSETLWVGYESEDIDFRINFIENYADPFGFRAYHEGYIVMAKLDEETKTRVGAIRGNADYFEAAMPVDEDYKKEPGFEPPKAESVYAVFLGGGTSGRPPLGINLPNDGYIRENYGSKSITIYNVMNKLGQSESDRKKEFVRASKPYYAEVYHGILETVDNLLSSDLKTEFHEILGHGSGKLEEGVNESSLSTYYNPIEEARAEVAALYHFTDYKKLLEFGIIPASYSEEQAKELTIYAIVSFFVGQMRSYEKLPETMTELKQAHQWGRQLIFNSLLKDGVLSVETADNGLPQIIMSDIESVRESLGKIWDTIQDVRSKGDIEGAKKLLTEGGAYTEQHRQWRKQLLDNRPKSGAKIDQWVMMNPEFQLVTGTDSSDVKDVVIIYSENRSHFDTYIDRERNYSKLNAERMSKTSSICVEALTN